MSEHAPAEPATEAKPLPLPTRLDTERLVLRPWFGSDAGVLQDALDESVEHLAPWIPWATQERPTPERTRTLLAGWIEQRTSGASFIYAILDRATERLLGGIGLYPRVGPGRLEIGYWLRRTASGRGCATEVTRALVAAGFSLDGIDAMEIRTDPANLASRRIPEKLGFRHKATHLIAEGAPRNTMIYVLERASAGLEGA